MNVLSRSVVALLMLGAINLAAGADAPPIKSLPTPAPEAPGAQQFPPPAPPKDPAKLGLGVQRTMTLLATSAPKHRNHVRVLFYGQSITEQEWSKQVADDLRRRFPDADLDIQNRAIGGFASQLLIRPVEHDAYPFYPDLVIFNVFGANQEYEQIIHGLRSRTATEVLIQTDRITQWPPKVIDPKVDKGSWWEDFMNHHFLPDTAKKYGCGLVDIHTEWLDYLKDNHLEPATLLLKDGAHLNAHGNYLNAQLTSRYLIYRPDLSDEAWKDLARTYVVGKDVKWDGKELTLEFDGNRVDFLPAPDSAPGTKAIVQIDGKKPSEFPGVYRITRPQPGPWSPLFLARVDHDAPLQQEDWSLKISNVSADGKKWDFDVTGSLTGADGSGHSDAPFVSKSGRVKIEPAAWFRGFFPPLPNGYEVKWQVLPMFMDEYTSPKIEDKTQENAVTIVQGIKNGRHTLHLKTDGEAPGILSIRVYRPPIATE